MVAAISLKEVNADCAPQSVLGQIFDSGSIERARICAPGCAADRSPSRNLPTWAPVRVAEGNEAKERGREGQAESEHYWERLSG